MVRVIMLNVIMLIVTMLNVVAYSINSSCWIDISLVIRHQIRCFNKCVHYKYVQWHNLTAMVLSGYVVKHELGQMHTSD
jgi:hypothetical protein